MNKQEIYEILAGIVKPENLTDYDFDLYAYSRDLSPAKARLASFVARPGSTVEVSSIMRVANQHKIPVYVRGCGCSHWAGWLPVEGGILLDMTRMNKIIEIDENNLTATVQSGCTWYKLDKGLRKRGLTYLMSEMGGPAMTVGGSVIKAGGGPYGTCKFGLHGESDVLGFEVVLPTGEVVRTGSGAHLNSRPFRRLCFGPDLTGLLIGSEGTLGILTEVTLRVRPVPEVEEYLFFTFNRWQDVVEVGDAVTKPVGDELAFGFDTSEYAGGLGKIYTRVHLFGYDTESVRYRREKIEDICLKNSGKEGDSHNSEDFFSRALTGLKGIFSDGVWHFAGCGAIPIRALPRFAEAWRHIVVQDHNFQKSSFGAWMFPRGWMVYVHLTYLEPAEHKRVMEISDEINRKYAKFGIVPHGIGGPDGLLTYVTGNSRPYYDFIKKIKKALDPNNILQPGILIV